MNETGSSGAAAPEGRGGRKKVLLVDDHPIVRNGLAQLISQEPDLAVCGGAGSAGEAMAAIGRDEPDLVVVDISLKSANGIELTKAIRTRRPSLPVLVLSMHDEALYAERALRAGANGYVMKAESPETVLHAIREVLSGDLYVSEKIASRMLRGFLHGGPKKRERRGVTSLSDRELEIFEMIGNGICTRDIATQLNISIKTVETHRAHIKCKLGLTNATELMRYAISWVSGQKD